MQERYLELRRVCKSFGDYTAIRDISLMIAQGEFVTFLGPSGSGKSTTLYTVAGFIEPSSGEVMLNGQSLLGVPPNQRDIGMVFQRYTLFPHLTVAENIAFPLRVRRKAAAEIARRVEEMLALVHLTAMRDRKPAQLSGGQQQRVALARALAYNPRILLMDEPLSALDKKLREDMQGEIKRIHLETGVTIIYVTHDQEEALRLSDRIVLFNHGGIEQVGTGADLYDRPVSAFAAGFIGNSNLIAVRREAGCLVLPDGTRLDGVAPDGRAEARLLLRPEQLFLAERGMAATILDTAYLGDVTAYSVRTGWGQELSLRVPRGRAEAPAAPGATVFVGFAPASAYLVPEAAGLPA